MNMFDKIAISFKYDGKLYKGIDDNFKLISKEENEENNVKYTVYTYDFLDNIRVTVNTEEYVSFNAIYMDCVV